ncbi:hypothetical protein NEPTK9_000411 [Candidatus Neptunochlamydia vexilliferae]|uniref:Addiction module antidote protein, HigA family n=1 Tax=Candidatus Neptunichlamydia vexilliferae TaxID=1651774 RepID=A0ABS0AZL0_9BACT|nr:HigA family addiction module antitoxin [Candidatus Neptunochlamydia vexilliferae]MBF5058911.1 hypothetical protein [Candidatus Neptunochlamydia vexilliferae]
MANKMRPIHPGEVLKDELEVLDLSASALARALAVPANRISFILNGKRAVTADTAPGHLQSLSHIPANLVSVRRGLTK